MQTRGGAEAIGPIILGLKKPVHILQLGSTVREIVNMVTIAVVDAQSREAEYNASIKSDAKADSRTAKT